MTITKARVSVVPLPDPSNSSSTPLYRRWVIRNALGIFFLFIARTYIVVFFFFFLFFFSSMVSSNHTKHILNLSDLTSLCHTRSLGWLFFWKVKKKKKKKIPWMKYRWTVDRRRRHATYDKISHVPCTCCTDKQGGASASRISGVIVAPAKIRGYI